MTKSIASGYKIDLQKIQLSKTEARFLVDAYYTIQEHRKAIGNQIMALTKSDEPHATLDILYDSLHEQEKAIKKTLDNYTDDHYIGVWMKNIVGIGPVISAGLLAYLDIECAPTAGHFWSYAGLNPNAKWEKGQKRPWNAALKTLCWKIGESFVKVSAHPKDFYGKIWAERKADEIERNARGEYAEQAAAGAKRVGKNTEAYKHYKDGKLPPGHIHARAKRYAVKLFLAHLHEVWYQYHYGEDPPLPYPIQHLGHVHKIDPPKGEK